MRTYFHEFIRDNGLPIMVEYSATGGESNFDHPGHICDGGGSGPEIVILRAWPDTPFHNRLAGVSLRLMTGNDRTPVGWKIASALRYPVDLLMRADEWWRASLTADEDERMSAHLAEIYEDEPYEPEDYL